MECTIDACWQPIYVHTPTGGVLPRLIARALLTASPSMTVTCLVGLSPVAFIGVANACPISACRTLASPIVQKAGSCRVVCFAFVGLTCLPSKPSREPAWLFCSSRTLMSAQHLTKLALPMFSYPCHCSQWDSKRCTLCTRHGGKWITCTSYLMRPASCRCVSGGHYHLLTGQGQPGLLWQAVDCPAAADRQHSECTKCCSAALQRLAEADGTNGAAACLCRKQQVRTSLSCHVNCQLQCMSPISLVPRQKMEHRLGPIGRDCLCCLARCGGKSMQSRRLESQTCEETQQSIVRIILYFRPEGNEYTVYPALSVCKQK